MKSSFRGQVRLLVVTIAALLTVNSALNNDAVAAAPNSLTAGEIQDGWILLFDGETLYGWEAATKANWTVAGGAISVSEGEPGLLNTTSDFANYVLRLDFRFPDSTNSGVFLRTPVKPQDPATD